MKDTNKSSEKGDVSLQELEKGFNALSTCDDKKQNNLDKDEGSKFNNLSKDGGIEMSKKKVPEENTDDNEKKTLDDSSIKKESTDQEGNPLADKNRQRVNTQEVHDVAQQLEDLSLAGADDKKQGCLQARGPSGGVGKAHMFPETNYKSFNNHSDFQLPYEKQSGKRGIDSDFETPFYKFANPQEQVNYGVNLSAGVNHNLLNQDMIYHKNFSGGKMYTKPGFQDALAKPEFPDINIDDLPYAQGDFTGDDILAMAENTPTQVQHMPPFQSVGTFPTENPNRMPMMGNSPNDFGSFPTDLSYSKQKQDRDDPTSDYESSVYSPSSEVSLNSPPPSNDSGYGAPSPASDMVKSPSRMSTSGGTSPPRDGSQCGDIWSPMSEPPISPPQTVPDQCSYIDQHLDQLHDVLNVIGNDIKSQEDNRKKGRQLDHQKQSPKQPQPVAMPAQAQVVPPMQVQNPVPQMSPPYMGNMSPPMIPAPPYTMSQVQPYLPSHNAQLPSQHSPVQRLPQQQGFTGQPVQTSQNGQVIILPPATSAPMMNQSIAPKPIAPMTASMAPLPGTQPMAQMTAPMAQLPGTQSMAAVSQPITTSTGSFVIVPGPPTTAINSTPVPVPPVTSNGTCQIIIVTPQSAQPQKASKKPLRPLKPKMPSGDKGAGQNGEKSPGIAGAKGNPGKNAMNAAHNLRMQQRAAEMQKKQANLINVARRMVADIAREQLPFQDEEGDTYLHVAVCKTDPNMVKALLERLTRENMHHMIDLPNKHRQTPLYLAVAANQAQMVQMFVERNANPDSMAQAISADGKSMEVKAPLHVAASNGAEYLDTLQELLKSKDLSLNIVNSEGHTALHCAVLNHGRPTRGNNTTVNSLPIIEVLIKAGIEANSQAKKSGKTPLMYAIERRDYNLVESMLRLFDHSKLRSIIQSQTFDGSSCLKIAEGLKGEYKSEDWHKLWNLLNSAYQGQIMNNVLYNRTY